MTALIFMRLAGTYLCKQVVEKISLASPHHRPLSRRFLRYAQKGSGGFGTQFNGKEDKVMARTLFSRVKGLIPTPFYAQKQGHPQWAPFHRSKHFTAKPTEYSPLRFRVKARERVGRQR
jgi:hypothetical protein